MGLLSFEGTVNPENILPTVLLTSVGEGLRGILLLALIAASMSTFDTTVNMATGMVVNDVPRDSLQQVAQRAHWPVDDVVNRLPLGNARQVPSLGQLLGSSDVVSLHVPETTATQNMIGEKELSQMKAGGILINASRGTVVDIDALAAALAGKVPLDENTLAAHR